MASPFSHALGLLARSLASGRGAAFDLILLGAPLLIAWHFFADLGGFPANDDPFYGRPVQILVEEGRFQLVRQQGELTASSLAHVLAGAAVCGVTGFSYRHLFLAVTLQMWLGAAAVYGCATASGASRRWAVLLTATFCFTPLCFGHAFTFMSDGPAMAWLAVALFCFLRGLQRSSLVWLAAGSTVAGLVFWMRQTHLAVIFFPAIAVISMRLGRGRRQFTWREPAAIVSMAALSVLVFESGWIVPSDAGRLDDALPRSGGLARLREIAIAVYGQGLTLGLALLPLGPILAARIVAAERELSRSARLGCHAFAAFAGGLALAAFLATEGRACLTSATGTFLQNAHFGPIFLSDMHEPGRWGDMGGVAWPIAVWQGLTLLAIANVTLLAWWAAWTVAQRLRQASGAERRDPAIDCSLGLLAILPVITIGTLAFIEGPLDRYWMPLIPALLVWLGVLAGRQAPLERRTILFTPSIGMALALLAVSVVFLHDSLAWNQTRWRQVEAWLQAGMRPQDFDGGRDVNAWLRSAEDPDTRPRPGDTAAWWSGHAKICLAIGPRPGWREVDRLRWRAWATGREHFILILERIGPPPAAVTTSLSSLSESASLR